MSKPHPARPRVFFFHESGEAAPMLTAAMPDRVELHARFVTQPLRHLRERLGGAHHGFAWQQLSGEGRLGVTVVPGLRRYPRLSAWVLGRAYRQMCRRLGPPDVVVVDTPYLLEVLEFAEGASRIYLANDVYRFFSWDPVETDRRERALLQLADLTLAVAPLIVDDFRRMGATSVELLPTAVSEEFVQACRADQRAGTLPADLAAIPGPRICCVGKINDTYDWALIEGLMRARPEVSLALIGPLHESSASAARVFALPNVYWLGQRTRAEVPAYLAGSDILLNPLTVGDHNDRRFPLRLTEYMATTRPILSTDIDPVRYFAGEVHTARDIEGAARQLDRMLRGEIEVDPEARRTWLSDNTWNARTCQFIDALERNKLIEPSQPISASEIQARP